MVLGQLRKHKGLTGCVSFKRNVPRIFSLTQIQEYANWLVNYRETEREDSHAHHEDEDEQFEQQHDTHEVEREHHREHDSDVRRHMVDQMTLRLLKRSEFLFVKKQKIHFQI